MDLGVLGYFAALGLAACGSAIGIGIAGQAAIGVWKKAFLSGKRASAVMFALVGAPFTQTIYGYILMGQLIGALSRGITQTAAVFGIGLFGGLGIALSAWFQGKAAAAAADAYGESGKGFGLYMIVLGIIETIALLVMVFGLGVAKALV
jgi:V/A-type H+-transporting ATPase subunit K